MTSNNNAAANTDQNASNTANQGANGQDDGGNGGKGLYELEGLENL